MIFNEFIDCIFTTVGKILRSHFNDTQTASASISTDSIANGWYLNGYLEMCGNKILLNFPHMILKLTALLFVVLYIHFRNEPTSVLNNLQFYTSLIQR